MLEERQVVIKPLPIRIGMHLRQFRLLQGKTLDSVASEAGISGMQLSRLERGTRGFTLDTLMAVAESLGKPLSKIIAHAERG